MLEYDFLEVWPAPFVGPMETASSVVVVMVQDSEENAILRVTIALTLVWVALMQATMTVAGLVKMPLVMDMYFLGLMVRVLVLHGEARIGGHLVASSFALA